MPDEREFLDELQEAIPHLRRYARSLTSGRADADDLVQDTLERAIARQDRYREGSNLRSWTFTLMHNLHIDGCRRARRQRHLADFEEDRSSLATREPPRQLWALHLKDFSECFRHLRSDEQDVLLLVGLKGLPYEEAARQLGIALGTVKSRLFRARVHLREAGCQF